MLATLLVIPLIVAVYLQIQKRRRPFSGSFQTLGGVKSTTKQGSGFRRHVPPLLFLLSLAIILVALARPQAQIRLPRIEGTVVLVMDVSASMGATDVEPSRLEAAKTAAREFVLSQPPTVKIGIVSFSGSGFTVQAPTTDSNALLNTIARLEPTSGTSLGQGILSALNTIAVDAGLATDDTATAGDATATPPAEEGDQPAMPREEELLARLPEGPYPASVIALLTDGENNQSIDPLKAAQAAAEHDVHIHALGFGTPGGATIEVDGCTVHTALDEATLQQIVEAGFGAYYPALGDQDQKQVYAGLTPQLVIKPETMELTAVLAGAGILLLLTGSLLSLIWFNRLL
jgi:Ca-activated chloride channel family protein